MEAAAYPDSAAHVTDELRRIALLACAQAERWRQSVGASKPEELWGLAHVSDAEVDPLLLRPLTENRRPDPGGSYHRKARACAEAVQARVAATDDADLRLRLRKLVTRFGLSPTQRDVLLLALLPEVDPRYRRLFGYLVDDAVLPLPTVELAIAILSPDDPTRGLRELGADAPLHTWRLVELQGDALPLGLRPIRLDDRIAAFLLDRDGPALAPPRASLGDLVLDDHRRTTLEQVVAQVNGQSRAAVVLITGPPGCGRRTAVQGICAAAELPLIMHDVRAALDAPGGFDLAIMLAHREAALRDAALCWTAVEALLEPDRPTRQLDRLAAAARAVKEPVFLVSEAGWDPGARFGERPFRRVDLRGPSYGERCDIWQRHLEQSDDLAPGSPEPAVLAALLANTFQLTGGQILDALATARAHAALRDPDDPCMSIDDLHDGCRRHSTCRLVTFARRVVPRATLDDLKLPERTRRQLTELIGRIKGRNHVFGTLGFGPRLSLGAGVVALFTGASGTGKTMAAEALANDQRVDLYKVDLSAVVSKYVGETEKNLARVFAEAEDANAMIFFDEADALFGRRGEVREARDRWANVELSYLLQRVEEHAGVVVLASNLRQNIDEAFLRRIHAVVDFPIPDREKRLEIWKSALGDRVGRPGDDALDGLAHLRLSAGQITNAVVAAVFLATGKDPAACAVTLRQLVVAAAREYEKLGRPITRGEFGGDLYDWVVADLLLDERGA